MFYLHFVFAFCICILYLISSFIPFQMFLTGISSGSRDGLSKKFTSSAEQPICTQQEKQGSQT